MPAKISGQKTDIHDMIIWVGIHAGGFALNYEGGGETAEVEIDPAEAAFIEGIYGHSEKLTFQDQTPASITLHTVKGAKKQSFPIKSGRILGDLDPGIKESIEQDIQKCKLNGKVNKTKWGVEFAPAI